MSCVLQSAIIPCCVLATDTALMFRMLYYIPKRYVNFSGGGLAREGVRLCAAELVALIEC